MMDMAYGIGLSRALGNMSGAAGEHSMRLDLCWNARDGLVGSHTSE